MDLDRAALLLGLFVVPALLLWIGHRLRRRPSRWRAAFWGGVVAHGVAAVVATVAGILPPEEWAGSDRWRGALGFWSLLVAPVVGALLFAAFAGGDGSAAHERASDEDGTP